MMLPSKELLSEVLGCQVKDIKLHSSTILKYKYDIGYASAVNIYELMHMMKKWAFVEFNSAIQSNFDGVVSYATILDYSKDNGSGCNILEKDFIADTEPEAVTKACEWILEKQK